MTELRFKNIILDNYDNVWLWRISIPTVSHGGLLEIPRERRDLQIFVAKHNELKLEFPEQWQRAKKKHFRFGFWAQAP